MVSEPHSPRVRFPFLPAVLDGETADIYFLRTRQVLAHLGRDPEVGMVFFPARAGLLCGVQQVLQLLEEVGFDGVVEGLSDGEHFEADEEVMVLRGRYSKFGIYETALLGILASASAWATAARECVDAAGPIPVVSFGARHLHPNVASIMDAAAVAGGCVSCSTPLGAALAGVTVSGTMPHAFILIVGDTVEAARAFDEVMPAEVPRTVLVDTFNDEAVESVRVAQALGLHCHGVRLDTPGERGGVTPELVKEVRARLDLAGFSHVTIFVSGGVTPERIRLFRERGAPVDGFGVGSYITRAAPIDFTADIREIEGKPVAKRGRLPGIRRSPRWRKLR
jgi:nicotinate phosphoribosyltransferase